MKKLINRNFGIIQGRLVEPPLGQLQWFPSDNWEVEFSLASDLGFSYIELIAERQFNPTNPLWDKDGLQKIQRLTKQNNLNMESICNDYVIDHDLINDYEVVHQTLVLLNSAKHLGCKKLVLPLFERSNITLENQHKFKDPLVFIGNESAKLGIKLCLEVNMGAADLIGFLRAIGHPNIFLVYDTGNSFGLGHDPCKEIRMLQERIIHVHLKDKNAENQNVLLGTGLINFLEVFKALDEINYSGPYTFETTRGKDPIRTAKYNMEFAKFFCYEAMDNGG